MQDLRRTRLLLVSITLMFGAVSCSEPPEVQKAELRVTSWGTMREVLREGQSEGRVPLLSLGTPNAVGVGAMAHLAGEITILNGRILIATAPGQGDPEKEPTTPRIRDAVDGDSAALLVLAEVPDWEELPIGSCGNYSELDAAIGQRLRDRGHRLTDAVPVRVRGRGRHVELHVIAGACPIADPSGPPPWRFSGSLETVELVGFYVEEAAGKLTHHDRNSHLHAVTAQMMGHLDEVALDDAVLLLPAL